MIVWKAGNGVYGSIVGRYIMLDTLRRPGVAAQRRYRDTVPRLNAVMVQQRVHAA